ncbi:MAG: FecR domain-containing protein [Xanthobacteraceae bacterium]
MAAAQGSTQILFPDQSTLNIGRNSSLVIDEYVYDPNSGSGTMLASLTKGTLRFVGGQISHTDGVMLNTPVATLGIRGGVATVAYPITPKLAGSDPNLAGCNGQLVIGHVGTLTLKNKVSEVTIRPGFATCVNGANVPIVAPFRVSDVVLANVVSTLRSGPGQTGGGASTPPAAPLIATHGVGTVILNRPTHPPGTDPLGYTSIFGGGNDVVRSKSQATQLKSGTAPPPYGAH